MKSKSTDMLSGSITKGLLSMTIPIMIMNVMQSLFNIMDMTVLKLFTDDVAVGSVGSCGMLISLSTSLLIGLSAGANVIVARRIGSGKKGFADRASSTAVLLSLVGGITLMVIGLIFAKTFLELTNCPDKLLPGAVSYFKLYFCSVPFIMFYNFSASILRAIGDTKKPMYILLISASFKLGFTFLFVGVFGFNVSGVGISTIISNMIASILCVFALLKRKDIIRINFKMLKFDFEAFKDILYIGIPAGLQSSLYSLANVVITTAVNGFGADATTGIAIANQFDGILYQICYAPSLATTPYVAQNLGANNIKRIKQTVVRGIFITIAFGATFGFFSAFFSRQLSSIMSSTPAVIAYSRQKMIIISSTYFICGINEVFGGVMRGLGKPIIPTVATLVFMCLLRFIWVYAIFPHFRNLTFLYTVWPIGWILSIITLLFAYLPTISRLQKKSQK